MNEEGEGGMNGEMTKVTGAVGQNLAGHIVKRGDGIVLVEESIALDP